MINHRIVLLGCSASLMLGSSLSLKAAEWSSSASVTPGVTYTDNVCLSSTDEQDQWIGLLTPAGSIRADGNNANLRVNGSVQMNTLTDSKLENLGCSGGNVGSRDQFTPRLNGVADAVLVDQWLFVDGRANIYQNEVTPFASGGGDSLNRTGNTNTTYNYSISPYIARRFKDTAELNLRYTWDDQYNTVNQIGDSTEHNVQGRLGSVPGVSKFLWGISGNYSKVDYSEDRIAQSNNDSELKSAQVDTGYQINRFWQVNGYYGNEWNDFVSNSDDIDGSYWDTGLRWTPNSRTTVEAGYGERFFGNAPRFSATHRHKRSRFNASYSKTLTYDRNIRALDATQPDDPDFGPPPDLAPGQSTITNSPILDERFSLGYAFQARRSSLGLRAFQSEQTREENGSKSTFRGVSLFANRKLSQQTSLSAGMSWNEQEPQDLEDRVRAKSNTWSGTLGLNHRLSQSLTLGMDYRYTDRQSDNAFDEYTENRISLDLRVDL